MVMHSPPPQGDITTLQPSFSFSFSCCFSVIITTVLYLSDALRKNFLNDKFDYKVGENVPVFRRVSVWRSASKLSEYQTASLLKKAAASVRLQTLSQIQFLIIFGHYYFQNKSLHRDSHIKQS